MWDDTIKRLFDLLVQTGDMEVNVAVGTADHVTYHEYRLTALGHQRFLERYEVTRGASALERADAFLRVPVAGIPEDEGTQRAFHFVQECWLSQTRRHPLQVRKGELQASKTVVEISPENKLQFNWASREERMKAPPFYQHYHSAVSEMEEGR